MFNEQQQQQKRLKRQKFIDIAAIFQNFLSRNGRFSFEKLENIYSYCCYLFLKKKIDLLLTILSNAPLSACSRW